MSYPSTAVNLARGQSIALPDIRGTALMVQRGTLWITQENDTQDVTLREGDLWMVSRDGLTIIEAQNDASMQAVGPAFADAMRPHRPSLQWLWREAAELLGLRPRFVPYY
jgi:hypothetical protein